MSIRSLSALALFSVSSCLVVACGNGGASVGADNAAAVASPGKATPGVRSTKTATVFHNLVSPSGKVDGVLLKDGTVVRVPPGAIAADALVAGDSIEVEAETKTRHSGETMLVHPIVRKNGAVVVDLSIAPTRDQKGPGFHGHGGPHAAPFGAPGVDLPTVSIKGTIDALLTDHRGSIEAIVLDDGSTARIFGHDDTSALSLKVGDHVSITGPGTSSLAGTGMLAASITLASGVTHQLSTPPKPVAIEKDATIQRALLSPFGDIDTLLFADGSLAHLPPFAKLGAKLTAGQTIHLSGHGFGSFVHAETISSPSGEVLYSRPTTMPDRPETRPELSLVDESAKIAQVLKGPHDHIESLLLADGAVVRLSPHLAEQAASELAEGAMVHVVGKGGSYPGGTSLFAKTITTASGQSFTETGRHHGDDAERCDDSPPVAPTALLISRAPERDRTRGSSSRRPR